MDCRRACYWVNGEKINAGATSDPLDVGGTAYAGRIIGSIVSERLVAGAGTIIDFPLLSVLLTGASNTIQLPPLDASLTGNVAELYSSGTLSVFLAGDYNFDGNCRRWGIT